MPRTTAQAHIRAFCNNASVPFWYLLYNSDGRHRQDSIHCLRPTKIPLARKPKSVIQKIVGAASLAVSDGSGEVAGAGGARRCILGLVLCQCSSVHRTK